MNVKKCQNCKSKMIDVYQDKRTCQDCMITMVNGELDNTCWNCGTSELTYYVGSEGYYYVCDECKESSL